MAEFRPHVSEVRAAGGEVFIVGSGAPFFARAFAEDVGVTDVPIWCDEELRSYDLAGFRRDVLATLKVRSALSYLRARRKGFEQKGAQGNIWQQGGVLVVRSDGAVVYRYASQANGDHPPPEEIVAAVRRNDD